MPTVHKNTTQAGQQITRGNLEWGTLGSPFTLSFGFRTSAAAYTVPNHNITQFSAFSASEEAATRAALQLWADVANVTFVDQGHTNNATLLFENYSDPNDGSQAFAFFPQPPGDTSSGSSQGDLFMNLYYASTTVAPGDYNWTTLIHEIGHALGLQHPGDYNAGPGQKITYAANAEYIEDTAQYSIMSYFAETFTGANFQGLHPETPMLDDIAAIQRLYGANMNTRTGNTVYGFHSNVGSGSVFSITSATQKVVFCIWDAGGEDTLDFSGYSQAQTINLNAESFSSVGGLTSNVSIAQNVIIENAIGGSGNDTITGNAANNKLTGGLGNDTLDGGVGTDSAIFSAVRASYTLTGLTGNGVRVSGPDGTDTLTNIELLVFFDMTVNWPIVSGGDDYADSFTDTTSPFGQLAVNVSGTGVLETTGDRDWFRIQLVAGITYTINLQGQQAGAGTLEDPYLRVYNGSGGQLAENDDINPGVDRDSKLTFTPTTTGTYYVAAGAFDDNYSGSYKVSVTGSSPNDDFADSLSDATAPFGQVAANGTANGRLEVTGDRDWFRVQLVAGTTYTIDLQGLQTGIGTLEDPYLRLHGSSGVLLAQNDDIDLGVQRDSQLVYQASTTGTYYIEAGAFDDNYAGTYRVKVASSGGGGDDFADTRDDTTAPMGQLAIGGSTTGRLEVKGDRDWFRVQLVAGSTYAIAIDGQQAGGGTLEDPYLRLRNSQGQLLAQNDDIVLGVDRDSMLTFQATTSGTYYVEAGAYNDTFAGSYTVTIDGTQAPDDFADSLTDVSHPIGQASLIGSASGKLEQAGDRDWFKIQLNGGASYVVNLKGKSGGGTLADPYLRLYDQTGTLIFQNDDSAGASNRDSKIIFVAPSTGLYYIEAGAYQDGFAGTYSVGVSHALLGDAFVNHLIGGAENDSIFGFESIDTLEGGGGADILTGGLGADVLTGGADGDIFDFNSKLESGRGSANRDVVTDFINNVDRIDLSDIDAKKGSGNQAFKFIGTAKFHHQKGELHYVTKSGFLLVEGDINGDGKADFQIELTGLNKLTAADFVL